MFVTEYMPQGHSSALRRLLYRHFAWFSLVFLHLKRPLQGILDDFSWLFAVFRRPGALSLPHAAREASGALRPTLEPHSGLVHGRGAGVSLPAQVPLDPSGPETLELAPH